MPGPAIVDPLPTLPSWLKPENASVFDDGWQKALRVVATALGINDPRSAVYGMMAPLEDQAMTSAPLQKIGKAIKAFHGSPHDFEQFDLSKIGTGEGAQAYGHGLYFAESKGVAESYKDQLAGRAPTWENAEVAAKYDPFTLEAIKRELQKGQSPDDIVKMNAQYSKLAKEGRPTLMGDMHDALKNKDVRLGRMYEVAIHADPEDFLDWDKPLSQQPTKVQEALQKIGVEPKPVTKWQAHQLTQQDIDAKLVPSNYAPGSWISVRFVIKARNSTTT